VFPNSVIFPLNKIAKMVIYDKSLKPPLFGGECSFFKNQTAFTYFGISCGPHIGM
jgi:hypothetical protein